MIQSIAIFNDKQQILSGRFYQFILTCCQSFVEKFLSVVDDAVGFGEYLFKGFVRKHRGTFLPAIFAQVASRHYLLTLATCSEYKSGARLDPISKISGIFQFPHSNIPLTAHHLKNPPRCGPTRDAVVQNHAAQYHISQLLATGNLRFYLKCLSRGRTQDATLTEAPRERVVPQSLKKRAAELEQRVKERAETVKKVLREYREVARSAGTSYLKNPQSQGETRLLRKRRAVERANAEYMQLQKELDQLRLRIQARK